MFFLVEGRLVIVIPLSEHGKGSCFNASSDRGAGLRRSTLVREEDRYLPLCLVGKWAGVEGGSAFLI